MYKVFETQYECYPNSKFQFRLVIFQALSIPMTSGYHSAKMHTSGRRKMISGEKADMQDGRMSKTSDKNVGKPYVPKEHWLYKPIIFML